MSYGYMPYPALMEYKCSPNYVNNIFMDGVPTVVKELMKKMGWEADDVQLFFFANIRQKNKK